MHTPNHLAGLAAVVFCLVAEPAVAGPDWSMIERSRTAKQVEKMENASGTVVSRKQVYTYGPRAPYSPPYNAGAKGAGLMPDKAIMVGNADN